MRTLILGINLAALAGLAACAPQRGDAEVGTRPPTILVAADGTGGVAGSLYEVALDDSESTELGSLPVGFTGLAFDGRGDLYGVESGGGAGAQLWLMDPRNPDPEVIGPLVDATGGAHSQMPDITFSGAILFGWTERSDGPVTIDPETGEVTTLGGGTSSHGSGLAADSADAIWSAPQGPTGQLFSVDPETGQVNPGPTLSGSFRESINSMTFVNGTLYGVAANNGADQKDLVTIDTESGEIVLIGSLPARIDSLAGFPP